MRLPSETSGRWRIVVAILLALLVFFGTGWLIWSWNRDKPIDLLAGLPRDGVVAADVAAPQTRGGWKVTSGTLMTHEGDLWSGQPDEGPPDAEQGRTGNAVLRVVTERQDFREMTVRLEMRTLALKTTSRTPEQSWDGVHLFLRYQNPDNTYTVDLMRRDGSVTIKRKTCDDQGTVGQDEPCEGGEYSTLAEGSLPRSMHWRRYVARVVDQHGGTKISLSVDGRPTLSVVDRASEALHGAGRVGLRGDNAEFIVRTFEVVPM